MNEQAEGPVGEDERELGFSAAMVELEAILRRVEGDETDIDTLGEELQRAAHLLEVCRSRLRKVESEVGEVLDQIEGE